MTSRLVHTVVGGRQCFAKETHALLHSGEKWCWAIPGQELRRFGKREENADNLIMWHVAMK